MDLLAGLLELIAPTRCAGCEFPGELFCTSCLDQVRSIDPRWSCPACSAPYGHLVCTECWDTEFSFEAAVCVGELAGGLARAVVLHKDAGERRLGECLGGLVALRVTDAWGGEWQPDAVTWVPPTAAALHRRGFDHGLSLAQPVARALGVSANPTAQRHKARDQRTLDRETRLGQSRGAFTSHGVAGEILIVDDVMTTGATLDAMAVALLDAGADSVRVAVVARAW